MIIVERRDDIFDWSKTFEKFQKQIPEKYIYGPAEIVEAQESVEEAELEEGNGKGTGKF